jgi:hypothetical protein
VTWWTKKNQTLLNALPASAQRKVIALVAGVGGPHFADAVTATNTFLVEINGLNHTALLPMILRLNHDCHQDVQISSYSTSN